MRIMPPRRILSKQSKEIYLFYLLADQWLIIASSSLWKLSVLSDDSQGIVNHQESALMSGQNLKTVVSVTYTACCDDNWAICKTVLSDMQ